MNKASLKAQMIASAEAAIEKLLGEQERIEQERTLTLSDIEQMVVKMGQSLEVEVTRAIASEGGQARVSEESCPRCGQQMHYKGQKARQIVTLSGEVRIERAYYYCRGCGKGYFPPR